MHPGYSLYHDDERDLEPYQPSHADKVRYAKLRFSAPAEPTRNRDIVWFKRDGSPLKLYEMDDDHLLNTIALLGRKAENWQKTKALADGKGMVISEPTMYGKPLEYWSNAMLKELNRRNK